MVEKDVWFKDDGELGQGEVLREERTATSTRWQKGPYYKREGKWLSPGKTRAFLIISHPDEVFTYDDKHANYRKRPRIREDAAASRPRYLAEHGEPAVKVFPAAEFDGGKEATVVELLWPGQSSMIWWFSNETGTVIQRVFKDRGGPFSVEQSRCTSQDVPDAFFEIPPKEVLQDSPGIQ